MDMIRRSDDGKICCLLESTTGFPLLRLAQAKLGAEQLRVAPVEMLGRIPLDGDGVGGVPA